MDALRNSKVHGRVRLLVGVGSDISGRLYSQGPFGTCNVTGQHWSAYEVKHAYRVSHILDFVQCTTVSSHEDPVLHGVERSQNNHKLLSKALLPYT